MFTMFRSATEYDEEAPPDYNERAVEGCWSPGDNPDIPVKNVYACRAPRYRGTPQPPEAPSTSYKCGICKTTGDTSFRWHLDNEHFTEAACREMKCKQGGYRCKYCPADKKKETYKDLTSLRMHMYPAHFGFRTTGLQATAKQPRTAPDANAASRMAPAVNTASSSKTAGRAIETGRVAQPPHGKVGGSNGALIQKAKTTQQQYGGASTCKDKRGLVTSGRVRVIGGPRAKTWPPTPPT